MHHTKIWGGHGPGAMAPWPPPFLRLCWTLTVRQTVQLLIKPLS